MFAAGVILLLINLFDSTYGDAHNNRTLIFCGLMVGATVLGGIVKAFSKDEDS